MFDQSGAALPGATVTATSPEVLAPARVTDNNGFYRLLNLPPGTYTTAVELQVLHVQQEGILLRGGANFAVDGMKIGALPKRSPCRASADAEVSKPATC
jgi:hypothetical protein